MKHLRQPCWIALAGLLLTLAAGTALAQAPAAAPPPRPPNPVLPKPQNLNPYFPGFPFMGNPYPFMGGAGAAAGNVPGNRGATPYPMPAPSGSGYGGASGGTSGNPGGATVYGSQDTTSQQADSPTATLLQATGLPTDRGHIRWPVGLRSLASPEAEEVRKQIDSLFGHAAGASVSAPVAQEIDRGVRKLRRLLFEDREERAALPHDVYVESERFLDRLQRAGKLLQAGVHGSKAQMTTQAKPTEVHLADNQFQPPMLTVSVGTMVRWINRGQHPHTVTADDERWTSGELGPGEAYGYTFTRPGTYSYHCTVHPDMRGTITVK